MTPFQTVDGNNFASETSPAFWRLSDRSLFKCNPNSCNNARSPLPEFQCCMQITFRLPKKLFVHLQNYFQGKANFEKRKVTTSTLKFGARGQGDTTRRPSNMFCRPLFIFQVPVFTCEIISVNSLTWRLNAYIFSLRHKMYIRLSLNGPRPRNAQKLLSKCRSHHALH